VKIQSGNVDRGTIQNGVRQPKGLSESICDILFAGARYRIVLSDDKLSADLLCRSDLRFPLIKESCDVPVVYEVRKSSDSVPLGIACGILVGMLRKNLDSLGIGNPLADHLLHRPVVDEAGSLEDVRW